MPFFMADLFSLLVLEAMFRSFSLLPIFYVILLLLMAFLAMSPALADEPYPGRGEPFVAGDGARLPLRAWLPEGRPWAVLLAVHGFNDHAGFIADAAGFFALKGVAVYAYDQRGFGRAPERGLWPGEEKLTADLGECVAMLRGRHPDAVLFVLGESMGGAVVLAAGQRPDFPRVDGIILSAPAVWGRAFMPWYQRLALETLVRIAPGLTLTGKSLGIRASDNDAMLRELGSDRLFIRETRVDATYGLTGLMDAALAAPCGRKAETLVLYGKKDQLIPAEPMNDFMTRTLADPASRCRFVLYEDGWHMLLRDLQRQVVWADILTWLRGPAQPLPSVIAGKAVEHRTADGSVSMR